MTPRKRARVAGGGSVRIRTTGIALLLPPLLATLASLAFAGEGEGRAHPARSLRWRELENPALFGAACASLASREECEPIRSSLAALDGAMRRRHCFEGVLSWIAVSDVAPVRSQIVRLPSLAKRLLREIDRTGAGVRETTIALIAESPFAESELGAALLETVEAESEQSVRVAIELLAETRPPRLLEIFDETRTDLFARVDRLRARGD